MRKLRLLILRRGKVALQTAIVVPVLLGIRAGLGIGWLLARLPSRIRDKAAGLVESFALGLDVLGDARLVAVRLDDLLHAAWGKRQAALGLEQVAVLGVGLQIAAQDKAEALGK